MSSANCNFDRSHCASVSSSRSRTSCTARTLRRETQSFAQTATKKPKRIVSSDKRFEKRPPGGSKATQCTSSAGMVASPFKIRARRHATPAPSECPVQTTPQPCAGPPGASASLNSSTILSKASSAQQTIVECAKKPVLSSNGGSRASAGPAMPSGSKKVASAQTSAMQSLTSMVPLTATTNFWDAMSRSKASGGDVAGPRFSQVAQRSSASGVPSRDAASAIVRRNAFSFSLQRQSPSTVAGYAPAATLPRHNRQRPFKTPPGDGMELCG
mmetsp:Transcript_101897/g.287544  ORF Transcript_101897/g.287544 Transcript_101897/m.287544 type:complete len:271 (-) Transcript_101897:1042-1854(-)